jgi:hypothetical protein
MFFTVMGGILMVAGVLMLLDAGWKVTVKRTPFKHVSGTNLVTMRTGLLDAHTHSQVILHNPRGGRIIEYPTGADTSPHYQLLVDSDVGPVPATMWFGLMRAWQEEAKARLEVFLGDPAMKEATIKEPKFRPMIISGLVAGAGLAMLLVGLLVRPTWP